MNFEIPILKWMCLLIGYAVLAGASPWVAPQSLELLDELNDAEIYKAVVSSMNDWQRKQNLKKVNNRTKRQEDDSRVCYADLGCFEASGPFGYLDMLPSSPEEISTKFLLYPGRSRRRSGSPPAEIFYENMKEAFEWAKNGLNSSLPTKVLIHGFGSDCGYIWIYEMRSALLGAEEVNFICVDWEKGALLPNYVKASANTRLVGKQLALLIRGLVENNGLSLRNLHLIGFSLGAHIAGFAGAELGNVSRITGLDPAGPLFESQDPRARLDQSDATFVDVIHSNGEKIILGGLGTSQPMGHVDFYPNGGREQIGCSHLFVGAVSDIIWSSTVEGRSLCNHRRAYKFFIDSISPRCHFPAFPCESYDDFLGGKCFPCTDERKCGNMGYYADRSKGRGQMFLVTRDEEPFCAHQYLVKIETSPSPILIKSYGKIQITLIGDSLLNETFMMTRKEDEEMKLGESISRILVPHPILSQPTRVQILYTAYRGWLSSGLTQWKMDKVTLMDSFGKLSSVCKKNLVLDSGVPVTLPLYPGECNLPTDTENQKEAEDRMQDMNNINKNATTSKEAGFRPTPVIKIGLEDTLKENRKESSLSVQDALGLLNLPWKNDKENKLEELETESSRAFNTRIVKAPKDSKEGESGIVREIVEPILKPQSTKNARSHNLDKEKPEISEPILGPTTSKNFIAFNVDPIVKNDFFSKIAKQSKELTYNFYDTEDGDDWIPTVQSTKAPEGKHKREDQSKVFSGFLPPDENPLEAIATTVQFLPQRLARMFEQAEKYTRETILPLVSTYTPKFITDIITPKEKPRYLPLTFEEPTTSLSAMKEKIKSNLPPKLKLEMELTDKYITTPYTHIQKIKRKVDKVTVLPAIPKEKIIPLSTEKPIAAKVKISTIKTTTEKSSMKNENKTVEVSKPRAQALTSSETSSSRKARDDLHVSRNSNLEAQSSQQVTQKVLPTTKKSKAIYIDLPVFLEPESKYIPLSYKEN